MKFLADENFPLESYKALKEEGWDIESMLERKPGATDEEVLSLAFREGRIILTFDKDFGRLAILKRAQAKNGIVLLRFLPAFPLEAYKILRKALDKGLDFKGKISVITRETIRQRKI